MKKTRIVATVGPASDSKENMKKIVEAGVNVFRLNFSHGTHESHQLIIDKAKEVREEIKRPLGILADLQGPRIRVGNTEPFEIEKGEIISVSDKKTASAGGKELIIDSDGVASALQVGERILVEDGVMRLQVVEKLEDSVRAEVKNGGMIKPRKGINVPDTKLAFGAVTEKDRKDLEFALKNEVDFVALSFVSNAQEVIETRENIKRILGRKDSLPQIVVKVERKEAIDNIDEIIEAADIVMVARGDLGIELAESKVVIYQKEIIAKCLRSAKPVIVATQMLDSMINNPIPTRAEVSDVSNAVIDHTDAVMLSGESANGKYPVEAVETMTQIIQDTEDSPFDDMNMKYDNIVYNDYDSVINSAHDLAVTSGAKAIVLFSDAGTSARMMAHHRPEQMILVATCNPKTYSQMSIVWGARSYLFECNLNDREDMINEVIELSKKAGRLQFGDKVVVILGKIPGRKDVALTGIRIVE
ncbi:MAG: pyruvate kinase [Candidatus Moranbacteria bacterium]|nr:pyruvate kinase [Candidatus Moranbacteria bacterium]